MNASEEAVVVVDEQMLVRYMNHSAQKILNIEEHEYSGRHFYDDLNLLEVAQGRVIPILQEIMQQGTARRGIYRKTKDGKRLCINAVPLFDDGEKKGLLLTAQDVTSFVEMEQELDFAFALTLPNSKVEHKLKSLVEYQDTFDPDTNKITVTGVIQNGGYRTSSIV